MNRHPFVRNQQAFEHKKQRPVMVAGVRIYKVIVFCASIDAFESYRMGRCRKSFELTPLDFFMVSRKGTYGATVIMSKNSQAVLLDKEESLSQPQRDFLAILRAQKVKFVQAKEFT